jgi:hypothetical protein
MELLDRQSCPTKAKAHRVIVNVSRGGPTRAGGIPASAACAGGRAGRWSRVADEAGPERCRAALPCRCIGVDVDHAAVAVVVTPCPPGWFRFCGTTCGRD